jgi:phospholipid/cholesterol/gamma-HCH transport system permease protein
MVPYMFGYIMAAKVGTGIVAELGAMRINEEIDALEVIGVRPVTFLASYLAVVHQIGEVSAGGYSLVFWMFQNPPDLLSSVIKGMAMATAIVVVGCYSGYTASEGSAGVGQATAKSMILTMVLLHLIGTGCPAIQGVENPGGSDRYLELPWAPTLGAPGDPDRA